MKQILFKYFMLITCVFGLSGCGYLLSFGLLMFDGSCADWNCSEPTPRWKKAVDDCVDRNFEIVKQKFGHKDYEEVAFSDVGQLFIISVFTMVVDTIFVKATTNLDFMISGILRRAGMFRLALPC